MAVPFSLFAWWLDDEQGGQHPTWQRVRDGIVAHDQTCSSLDYVWLPRNGGVSCPSDLDWCEDCGVCFFNEGVNAWPHWEAEDRWYLCECCFKGRNNGELQEGSQ